MKICLNLLKKRNTYFFIISVLIWLYIWLRAYTIPLYFDEISTFFIYVQKAEFIPYHCHADANNHLLNSAFSTLFYNIFGVSELCLRLTNILAFPFYAFFVFKLSDKLGNVFLKWILFLTLLFSHNFIDYFTVSRGYGLSMGFLPATLYYLIEYFEKMRQRDLTVTLLFGILCLASNLTLINFFTILLSFILVFYVLNFKKQTVKNRIGFVLKFLIIGIVPLLYFVKYSFYLKEKGLLYLGSGYDKTANFYNPTLVTVTDQITASHSYQVYIYTVLLFFVTTIFFIIVNVKKPILQIFKRENVFFLFFLANILMTIFLFKFFEINYPIFRAGIYFFPLFIIPALYMFDRFVEKSKINITILILLPLLSFPISFLRSMNLSHSELYFYEVYVPKNFYEKIITEQKQCDFPLTIGGDDERKWYFLSYTDDVKLNVINKWNYPGSEEDFQIVPTNEISKWSANYDVIDKDKFYNYCLLKRKHFLKREMIIKKDVALISSNEEYINLFTFGLDTIKSRNLYINYEFAIDSKEKPFNSNIVAQVNDKKGNMLKYCFIALSWLKYEYNNTNVNFRNGVFIDKIPDNAASICIYLWNIKKKECQICGRVNVFKMNE